VFFKKRPHFWAKNRDIRVFGLKTRVKKRKYEPKTAQKAHKRAQISMVWRQKKRINNVEFSLFEGSGAALVS
jgi:hypothetical protein